MARKRSKSVPKEPTSLAAQQKKFLTDWRQGQQEAITHAKDALIVSYRTLDKAEAALKELV